MKTFFITETIKYTGEQLSAGWAAAQPGAGESSSDVAAAFLGPCDVLPEFMVDLEDLRTNQIIFSEMMLHFIIEHASAPLETAVLRQRLFASLSAERINARLGRPAIIRRGDDLFDGGRKLSISIATLSPRSALIHFAVNIETSDYPLPVKGIADYGIEPRPFAEEMLAAYAEELADVAHAQGKVRRVGLWKDGK